MFNIIVGYSVFCYIFAAHMGLLRDVFNSRSFTEKVKGVIFFISLPVTGPFLAIIVSVVYGRK